MKFTLISKKKEISNVKTFVFKPEKPILWKAGQYLIYSLPHENQDLRGKMRFFTISSSPFEKNPSITTRIFGKKGSSFKNTLDSLKIGDEINAKGPDGDFIIKDYKKSYVFIAGGIGITPFHSILKQLDFEKKKIRAILLYTSSNKSFVFEEELNKLAYKNYNLEIIYMAAFKKIDKKILENFKDSKYVFFVSGPDPMVDVIENILLNLKIPKENIKLDYFSGYKKV